MLGDMYASGARTIDGIRNFAAGLYPELNQWYEKKDHSKMGYSKGTYLFITLLVLLSGALIVSLLFAVYHWFQQYLYGRCI